MEEIIDCIRAVARRQTWISSKVGAHLAKRISEHELTPRENEVVRELTVGKVIRKSVWRLISAKQLSKCTSHIFLKSSRLPDVQRQLTLLWDGVSCASIDIVCNEQDGGSNN